MAERLYFPLKRTTTGDADRVVDDPLGYFSCLLVTAKFLDIENLGKPSLRTTNVKPTKIRTLNRADGSTVSRSPGNTSGIPAEHDRAGGFSKGARRVVLITGKKIDARVGAAKASYHTISFRFPSFATIIVISDALATIIPANKMRVNPSATDISPYFKVVGGRKYPIMQKAAAESRQDAVVPLTAAQIAALGGGVSFIPGAGI